VAFCFVHVPRFWWPNTGLAAGDDGLHLTRLQPASGADKQQFALSNKGFFQNKKTGKFLDEYQTEVRLRSAADVQADAHDKDPWALSPFADGTGTVRRCRQQDPGNKYKAACDTLSRDQASSVRYMEYLGDAQLRDLWTIVASS
jgi:hypothetical protein